MVTPPGVILVRRRLKTKTGCRTCKIRKIKCGEERPSCLRCVSTGRKCDGYGVSQDASNKPPEPPTDVSNVSHDQEFVATQTQSLSNIRVATHKVSELAYLDWFAHKTAIKLPGVYRLPFWRFFLLQVGATEPAVLHAVLALSSAHRAESQTACRPDWTVAPRKDEQFSLARYCQAISDVQPLLSAGDRASVRVALITCPVFVCLEFLQGRFQTGLAHLKSGLKLVQLQVQRLQSRQHDHVDEWVYETFARLSLQVGLFDITFLPPEEPFRPLWSPCLTFDTISQARRMLECLMQRILSTTHTFAHLNNTFSDKTETRNTPLDDPVELRAALRTWFHSYTVLQSHLQTPEATQDRFASVLLKPYYTLAVIMAETCSDVLTQGEMIYDSQLANFIAIINQSLYLLEAIKPIRQYTEDLEVCHYSIDIGWLPPLYFTALKCRNHRVRLHAIKLLGLNRSREGIWDSLFCAAVAREVMRIEEVGEGQGGTQSSFFPLEDEFSYLRDPWLDEEMLHSPVPCAERRLGSVRVLLPDGAEEALEMRAVRRKADGELVEVRRRLNVKTEAWSRSECCSPLES